ncbi:MAG: FkbM family methyltransferase [Desulfobacterales bacterium]|nr:FkbM family methyltransferase [Desulfobacterales bacterium]
MLSTRSKIGIARIIGRSLLFLRKIVGLPSTTVVSRSDIRWALDLREGIDLAIYLGQYQKIDTVVEGLLPKANAVVFDIGANIGAFTLPLAQMVGPGGHVVAIEATDFAYQKLVNNIQLNAPLHNRILPVQAQLTDTDNQQSQSKIYASWPLVEDTGARHHLHLGVRKETTNAEAVSLDKLVGDRPDLIPGGRVHFLKIDVDGNELDVLQGAGQLLSTHRPVIQIEIAPYVQNEIPGRLEELLNLIAQHGYRFMDFRKPTENFIAIEMIEAAIPYGTSRDLLAVPSEAPVDR